MTNINKRTIHGRCKFCGLFTDLVTYAISFSFGMPHRKYSCKRCAIKWQNTNVFGSLTAKCKICKCVTDEYIVERTSIFDEIWSKKVSFICMQCHLDNPLIEHIDELGI